MTNSEHKIGGRPSKPGSDFGGFLLKAIVLFVVIAGGVAAGFLIANHLSRRGIAGGFALELSDLPNQTGLAVGDIFPDITVRDEQDSVLVLTPLVRDSKTVLGFVSKGCEPCDELRKFLCGHDAVSAGRCRVVLLAVGIQGYDAGGLDVFRIDRPTIDELEITFSLQS